MRLSGKLNLYWTGSQTEALFPACGRVANKRGLARVIRRWLLDGESLAFFFGAIGMGCVGDVKNVLPFVGGEVAFLHRSRWPCSLRCPTTVILLDTVACKLALSPENYRNSRHPSADGCPQQLEFLPALGIVWVQVHLRDSIHALEKRQQHQQRIQCPQHDHHFIYAIQSNTRCGRVR